MNDLGGDRFLDNYRLCRRHQANAAVPVHVVVPLHEASHPLAGVIERGEPVDGVSGPVLAGPEQRLQVGVVVTDPRLAEGRRDAELMQLLQQFGALERAAIVRVKCQRMVNDPFGQHCPLQHATEVVGRLGQGHLPAGDLAAEDIDHHEQVVVLPLDRADQPRVGVEPGRPVNLSSGEFPRSALRTGRATLTASGSPQSYASVSFA